MQNTIGTQLTIFDIAINSQIEKIGILERLQELSSQYLIDSHYNKITFGRTLTLHEIESSLMRFKRFPEYINKVYEILADYYEIIDETKYKRFYNNRNSKKR